MATSTIKRMANPADVDDLKGKNVGYVKTYGAGNARYLRITLQPNLRYGTLIVFSGGHMTVYNFNNSASKVEGYDAYTISQNGAVFTVDFQSPYAHWVAIAGGSVSQGGFSESN